MSLAQYVRFLLVGGLVALLTIAARELFGVMLGRDSATNYSVSVSLAYALGILLSYILNHRFTFGQGVPISTRTTVLFVSIALLGMAVTAILSLAIRYGTPVRTLTGSYSGTVAFGTAAVITSLLTYPLNALLVFRARNQS